MRKNRLYLIGVAGCLALAAGWGGLTPSGTALGDPPDENGQHHHGSGGGGGGEEAVLFDVTTPEGSAIQIIGVFDSEGDPVPPALCNVNFGPAEGRADKKSVLVNQPSAALQMDFLAAAALGCFTGADLYSLDCAGDVQIGEKQTGAFFVYVFRAPGMDGGLVNYRIDADAEIVSDGGNPFPKGEPVGGGYTVTLTNIAVSVDTGSPQNACEHTFPGPGTGENEVYATVRLDRTQ